jgi:uridylate kinase
MEIHAEVLLKATKVDGIYDSDPKLHKRRAPLQQLTYLDVLARGLNVMDSTAISLCKENNLPILVFNMLVRNNIRRVVCGEQIGTLVCPDGVSVLADESSTQ